MRDKILEVLMFVQIVRLKRFPLFDRRKNDFDYKIERNTLILFIFLIH